MIVHRSIRLAAAYVLIGALAAPSALALPPPTALDVPVDGGRPRVHGEALPPSGHALNPKKVDAKAKPAANPKPAKKPPSPAKPAALVKAKPKPAPSKKPVARALPRRTVPGPLTLGRKRARRTVFTPKTIIVMLDAGQLGVPRSLVSLASGFDTFPEIAASAFDLVVMRSANPRHSYGGRLGLSIPTIPASNWYNADGSGTPLFHDIQLMFLAASFEYAYRRLLFGPVGVQLRFGVGINIAIGALERVEVLPTCTASFETCPHWREVGRHGSALPSPVWPSARASGGLFVNLTDNIGVHVDVGLRDAMHLGVGLSLRR